MPLLSRLTKYDLTRPAADMTGIDLFGTRSASGALSTNMTIRR